ncbi:FAD-dependent oxidoreductase [uncultured Draconibacterium sp.]|uniref:NAD(P)/FAD-dependent oxidoreductase n=1 Tax=uncultured Draconibacterium sp. TaxID=1573823 RepID=UPI0032163EED
MKEVEFVIIGQGLAGTMLAFELLENGIDFKIVSSPLKSKASLVAAGMINPLVFKRLTKSWMVDNLLPEMQKRYREIEERLEQTFLFDKTILKPLSAQEAELWHERKGNPEFAAFIGEIGEKSPVEFISSAAAFACVNGSGYLNLGGFLNAAESYFRERNLILDADFLIEKAEANAHAYKVADFWAQKVVFCEGYHLNQNSLFDFVKLNPVKGEVLQIFAPDLSEDYILNKKVFVLPLGNHRFKVGSTYEWKDLTEQTTESGKISILERLDQLITAKYTVEKQWAGVRPTVIDRRPVLGRHPEFSNIFVFNGLGTKGVMLAPYFAKTMLQFLNDSHYSLSDEINVQRFYKK